MPAAAAREAEEEARMGVKDLCRGDLRLRSLDSSGIICAFEPMNVHFSTEARREPGRGLALVALLLWAVKPKACRACRHVKLSTKKIRTKNIMTSGQ